MNSKNDSLGLKLDIFKNKIVNIIKIIVKNEFKNNKLLILFLKNKITIKRKFIIKVIGIEYLIINK
jgi:hypothetical protein